MTLDDGHGRDEDADNDPGRLRPKLLAVAYRMLGSVADSEDVVQDAYLKLQLAEGEILSPEGWLVKATTRLCIDRLRQAKRREAYVGPWLPEPAQGTWGGATMDRLELAESLSMAFMVLLETLSPQERAAYLLREVFNYEYEEIADLLDLTAVNVRQIASRARRRIESSERRFAPAAEGRADDLAGRFFDACTSGDVGTIEALLVADVVMYSDGGGKTHASPRPIMGSARVARMLSVAFPKRMKKYEASVVSVNGQPGLVFWEAGKAVQITTISVANGTIAEIYTVLNPEKLSRWNSATNPDV
ncbi:RNA polymerase sigma factor SigJ [Isosphaeraceae bacterium EP7]